MSCESCYNGCVQVTSDECVRYTGPDSLPLEIQTGDSLAIIEGKLIEAVTSFFDGSGIKIELNPSFVCGFLQSFLPTVQDSKYPLPDLLTGMIRAICTIQDYEIPDLYYQISLLQGEYDTNCLVGVTPTDGTFAVLQATINKLCQVEDSLTTLTLNVNTNYVKLSDLNSLIQAYLDSQSSNVTQQYQKMVPYTAVEYYGPLTNFDGSGAGLQNLGWDKVYLCNGANGTPDKRGRATVGAIQDVPGGPLSPAVDPTYSGNPNYAIGDVTGTNTVTLTLPQIPSHTHSALATSIVTDNGHSHSFAGGVTPGGAGDGSRIGVQSTLNTSTTTTGITVATSVTNSNSGGGLGHSNIQPVIAAYYIMYIP